VRIWTLAEATAALPVVRAHLKAARDAQTRMRDADEQISDLRIVWGDKLASPSCPEWAEHREQQARRAAAVADLAERIDAFDRLGVEVKDVEQGLVDFRGHLGADVVYLCWRDGEQGITHWHTLEGGFRGRKPIPSSVSL